MVRAQRTARKGHFRQTRVNNITQCHSWFKASINAAQKDKKCYTLMPVHLLHIL